MIRAGWRWRGLVVTGTCVLGACVSFPATVRLDSPRWGPAGGNACQDRTMDVVTSPNGQTQTLTFKAGAVVVHAPGSARDRSFRCALTLRTGGSADRPREVIFEVDGQHAKRAGGTLRYQFEVDEAYRRRQLPARDGDNATMTDDWDEKLVVRLGQGEDSVPVAIRAGASAPTAGASAVLQIRTIKVTLREIKAPAPEVGGPRAAQ